MAPDADPDSIAVMTAVDRLPKPFRLLVHEYGAKIVTDTYADGTRNAKAARAMLETWQERRQADFLAMLQR